METGHHRCGLHQVSVLQGTLALTIGMAKRPRYIRIQVLSLNGLYECMHLKEGSIPGKTLLHDDS